MADKLCHSDLHSRDQQLIEQKPHRPNLPIKKGDTTPLIIPSTVVLLSLTCTGLSAHPSRCPTHVSTCLCLPVCWPAFLPFESPIHSVADQPTIRTVVHPLMYLSPGAPSACQQLSCPLSHPASRLLIFTHVNPPACPSAIQTDIL